jgi:hypothetical protein
VGVAAAILGEDDEGEGGERGGGGRTKNQHRVRFFLD